MAREEEVLAVATAVLFRPGRFQGLQLGGEAWLEAIFTPRHSRYLPRAEAETNEAWKQIIPYVILACGERVFAYRRGKAGGEARLHALHSAGLGGHIARTDESLFAAPGWPSYQAALEREIEEEVEIAAPVRERKLVGLINDDAVPVGRVHIGLVHIWRLEAEMVRARETKITSGRFASPGELLAPGAPELESWSRFCLAAWDQLAAQPGWAPA
jgi:predicted NUDIX family phosphoesterase